MALARLTCGKCGGVLGFQDLVCPHCRERVEIPGREQAGLCRTCGHQNDPAAVYCQSCGARLSGGKRQKAAAVKEQGSKRDPWPYVALGALAVLVAIIFSTRGGDRSENSPAGSGTSAMPVQPPVAGGANPAEVFQAQQALNADPQNPALMLRLANVFHDNGQFQNAIAQYRSYLKVHPDNPDARVDMGICYYQLGLRDSVGGRGQFAEAIGEMRTALHYSPRHQPAAFNMAVVFLQMENLDSSNVWFRRAADIDRNSDLGMKAERILKEHAFMK